MHSLISTEDQAYVDDQIQRFQLEIDAIQSETGFSESMTTAEIQELRERITAVITDYFRDPDISTEKKALVALKLLQLLP